MSVSVTLEAMLAVLNKEHVDPIASTNPYDARMKIWLRRQCVAVAVNEYGAYGLRMFIWQAHEAQSRIRDWRVIWKGKWKSNSDINPNMYMHQDITSFFLAKGILSSLPSGVNGLRPASQAATQPLTPSDYGSCLNPCPKEKKMEVFIGIWEIKKNCYGGLTTLFYKRHSCVTTDNHVYTVNGHGKRTRPRPTVKDLGHKSFNR